MGCPHQIVHKAVLSILGSVWNCMLMVTEHGWDCKSSVSSKIPHKRGSSHSSYRRKQVEIHVMSSYRQIPLILLRLCKERVTRVQIINNNVHFLCYSDFLILAFSSYGLGKLNGRLRLVVVAAKKW